MEIKSILILLFISLITLSSCEDDVIVKPSGMLRLDYPSAAYETVETGCKYSFEKNEIAQLIKRRGCGTDIYYPKMKATVYLTYHDVQNNNLDSLLYDAQKLAYDHTIKANSIPNQPFVNPDKKVYGMFYMINGNAASQAQFYATDSIKHFITGSLYFSAKPNFDSILPAAVYIREDIRKIMETITWE